MTALSVERAVAETSTQLSDKEPFQTYLIYKTSIAGAGAAKLRPEPTNKKILVGTICATDIAGGFYETPKTLDFALLATEVLYAEAVLRLFPESLWRDELSRYERAEVANIQAGPPEQQRAGGSGSFEGRQTQAFQLLVDKINQYQASRRELPRLVFNALPICEPSSQVQIVTNPKAEGVLVINEHSYKLCIEQGKLHGFTPLDLAKCDRWSDFKNVWWQLRFGAYVVFVWWSDGKYELRRIDVSAPDYRPDRNDLTFVINKPQ